MAYAYDKVDYPSRPVTLSHPAHLGALAALHGRKVAPFATSRVLEVGCGEGVNLMSMAMSAPDAEFVGIDLSEGAISAGRRLARAADLPNVRLDVGDILHIDVAYGQFDTIIAHGVYTWTPDSVRAALLRLASSLLKPDGLFYVSYNLQPGCRVRQMLRDVLKHVTRDATSPEETLALAGAALKSYEPLWAKGAPIGAALAKEARIMLGREGNALYHDELADIYRLDLFSDVVAAAKAVGLGYLCDAMPQVNAWAFFPESSEAPAAGLDRLEMEQREDFATMRQFRRSVFCFGGALACDPDPKRLSGLWARGQFVAEPRTDGGRDGKVTFLAESGVRLTVRDAEFIQFFADLDEAWPRAISLEKVAEQPELARQVIKLAMNKLVELATFPIPLSNTGGERPNASRLARAQIASGSARVASLRHYSIAFDDPPSLEFMAMLDGTRTRDELVDHVSASRGLSREDAREKVDTAIKSFAGYGLLTA